MKLRRIAAPVLLSGALVLGPSIASLDALQEDGGRSRAPLFASDEVLALTLEADFAALDRDRAEENPERPAVLWVEEADGERVRLDIQVRTRGNFRLRRSTCQFPNLRLNIRTGQARGSVFEGQDRLKLVGHCRDRNDFEQNTLEEFLVYRAYNLLTEESYRVRLARITYVDVNGRRDPLTRYAFLIESDESVAERLGGAVMDIQVAQPVLLDAEASVRAALFHYMIGNTDWSMAYLHNTIVVSTREGRYVPVPYDFDWSGLIEAPYASPDPSLGLRSVRDRLYRGFCRPEVDLQDLFALFNEKRDAIGELFRSQEGLDGGGANRAIRYLDGFYDIINSERRARSEIERACRDPGTSG